MSHGRHRKKGQGLHHHHGTASGPLGFLPPGILPSSLPPSGAPGAPPISTTAAAAAAAAAFPLPGFDIAVARPEEQTCVAESWQAITGPDALLPDEYVRLPLDELQPVFERDLRRFADKTVNPRERCRLAHYLGNFSCTASGLCMYEKAAWYVPTLYAVVKEVKDIYVSGAIVPRPCVAGYAMLALTSLVKQSMRVPFPSSVPPSSGKGHGLHPNGPHAVIDYLLGPMGCGDHGNGGSSSHSGSSGKQQRKKVRGKQDRGAAQLGKENHGSPRVLCIWTLLKHASAETARSRGALRTLSCALELLTTLELACMGRNSAIILSQNHAVPPSTPPPLLTQLCTFEMSTEATKLIFLKAASLILKHTQSRGDVCGVAQALGLFEVMGGGAENNIVEEGREGWKAFVAADGVMPMVAALESLKDWPKKRDGRKRRRRRRRVEEVGEEGEEWSTTLEEEEEDDDDEEEEESKEVDENDEEEIINVSNARQSDRLSILSFFTDLGPAHPTLILPAVSQLIKWAGTEGPAYEHERTFALLSLARFLEGGKEGEDAQFAAELGLFPVVVRRLQNYRKAVVAAAAGGGGGDSSGTSRPLSREVGNGGDNRVMMQRILQQLSFHSQKDLRSSSVISCLRDMVRYRKLTCASGGVWRLTVHVIMMAMLMGPGDKEGEGSREEEGRESQRLLTELQCVLKMVMLEEQEEGEEDEERRKEAGSAVPALNRGRKPTPPWLETIFARVFKGSNATAEGRAAVEDRGEGHESLEVGIEYLSLMIFLEKEGGKEGGMGEAEEMFWEGGTEGLLGYLRMRRTEELMAQLSLVMEEEVGMGGGMGGGPTCEVCKQTSEAVRRQALLRCARCRSVRYCSRECQVWHWRRGGHKEACEQLIAVAKTAAPAVTTVSAVSTQQQ
ncbi:zinc mynd-type [Nannochloropsis oceanica]